MKLHTVSFGCQMNVADTEEMGHLLQKQGYTYTPSVEEADAILINTCTVRQHAEDRAFSLVGTLKEWKEANPNRLLIIAGCAAERTKETLQKRFPFVDLVVGAKSIESFPEIIREALQEKYNWQKENEEAWPSNGDPDREQEKNLLSRACQNPVSAYITIMRGCNYTCSYCIVPFVRGRELYRNPQTIESEILEKVTGGAKEVLLLGQTVNSFHWEGWDFAKLLGSVGAIEGVERIRFMSPHPYYMTDNVIQTMAETPKVCEHIHLPLQSGSNRILNLMKRNYTRERYLEIVSKLRQAIPDICITTDIIVGFPTESGEDYNLSLETVQEIGFDGAYCFKFSPREGTKAASLEERIPETLIEERHSALLGFTEKIASERAKRYLGKDLEILFEEPNLGRTRSNHWVELESNSGGKATENDCIPIQAGQTASAQIVSAKNRKLFGRLIG